MLRSRNVTLFLFVVACFSLPVHAKKAVDDKVMISSYGVGMRKSCAAFVREANEQDVGKVLNYNAKSYYPDQRLYLEWLSGFLTAHSWMTNGKNIFMDGDANDLLTWIRSYCQKNHLDSFLMATNALFDELRNQQKKR